MPLQDLLFGVSTLLNLLLLIILIILVVDQVRFRKSLDARIQRVVNDAVSGAFPEENVVASAKIVDIHLTERTLQKGRTFIENTETIVFYVSSEKGSQLQNIRDSIQSRAATLEEALTVMDALKNSQEKRKFPADELPEGESDVVLYFCKTHNKLYGGRCPSCASPQRVSSQLIQPETWTPLLEM